MRGTVRALIATLVVLVVASIRSCSPSPRVSGSGPVVWVSDGGDKVAREELRASRASKEVLSRLWNGERISLRGARNEVLSFSVVLEAPNEASKKVSLSLDALEGPETRLRSRRAVGESLFDWRDREIEIFRVAYLPIDGLSRFAYETYDERHVPHRLRRSWHGEGEGEGTAKDRPDLGKHYPDIALPSDIAMPFDIAANTSQSVWVDIYIPAGAPAGRYRGDVVVSAEGVEPKRLPVDLEVWDFTLPEKTTAKTMVFYSMENVHRRYFGKREPGTGAEAARRVRDRHFQLAHRHRISLIDSNCPEKSREQMLDRPCEEWKPRLDGALFTQAFGYEGPGAGVGNGVFAIGPYGSWSWKDKGKKAMAEHSDRWAAWFERESPGTEYFLYLIDEATEFEGMERWARWIKEGTGPGRKLRSFATAPLPEAREKAPSVDIIASSFTVGLGEPWETAGKAYLSSAPKRFFLYNGARPSSGTFVIDDDGIALRALAWAQYKKGIPRWFYWESTYYDNYQGGTGETDVFLKAQTFGASPVSDPVLGQTGWNYANGEGVLFYPGTDRVFPESSHEVPGPFASLRLKHWRRGIQDVEYLALATERDPARVRKIIDKMVPKVLWEYGVSDPADPTWVRTDISWPADPAKWEEAREELAELILQTNLERNPTRVSVSRSQ